MAAEQNNKAKQDEHYKKYREEQMVKMVYGSEENKQKYYQDFKDKFGDLHKSTLESNVWSREYLKDLKVRVKAEQQQKTIADHIRIYGSEENYKKYHVGFMQILEAGDKRDFSARGQTVTRIEIQKHISNFIKEHNPDYYPKVEELYKKSIAESENYIAELDAKTEQLQQLRLLADKLTQIRQSVK